MRSLQDQILGAITVHIKSNVNLTIQIYGRVKTLGYRHKEDYYLRRKLRRQNDCPYCDNKKIYTADACWDCRPKTLRLPDQLQVDKEKWINLVRGVKLRDLRRD